MINTDTVMVDLVAGSSVIDDMEASTGVFGAMDLEFLAAYQVAGAVGGGRTTLTDDKRFIALLDRYMTIKGANP